MDAPRPVLISVVQYQDELTAGTLGVLDVIQAAARLGADGVELRREYWQEQGRELSASRDLARELGLLVTYATMATLFNTDADGARVLRRDIDDARALGSPQLRVFQGPAPADDDQAGWDAGREAVEYAATRGIIIALENYSGTPGGRVDEIKRVLDRIQSPALATNVDIGNYARHGEDVAAAIRVVGERAVSAHLKDHRSGTFDDPPTYLGGGLLPLRDLLAELDRLPQRLLYCFEFRGGGDPEGRIEQSLAYLRAR